MQIKLKGPAALVALVVILSLVGFRAVSARGAFDGEQGDLIRSHLSGVYASHSLPGLQTAFASGNDEAIDDAANDLVAPEDIEFTDVSVKGLGDEVIARVTIQVDGQAPPDGRAVRYFFLRRQAIGGWKITREVSAFQYYLKLL